jgi:hypothetical protein
MQVNNSEVPNNLVSSQQCLMEAIADGNLEEVKRIVNTPDVDLNFIVNMQVCVYSISNHF